jgi:hypothetical protein
MRPKSRRAKNPTQPATKTAFENLTSVELFQRLVRYTPQNCVNMLQAKRIKKAAFPKLNPGFSKIKLQIGIDANSKRV